MSSPALIVKPFISRLLTLVLIVSTLAVINPQTATADTAGTGACLQTFTKTGTGQVDVIESGGYCYVVFKNTGAVDTQVTYSWTRPTGVTAVDVLVVGGGGSGGARHGGGGGAGGFVQTDAYSISSAATVSIAVGAGGNGSINYYGTIGQASFFKSLSNGLTALGGGAGANHPTAGSGGSGGGAGSGQTPGGVTAQSQTTFSGSTITGISSGTSGATGANEGDFSEDYWAGGGGGGANSAGASPTTNGTLTTSFPANSKATALGGKGGDGKSVSWITPAIASALTIGHTSSSTVYFAGGGGGGIGVDGQAGGPGGLGGGATGTRTEVTGNAGTAFTGGGGGGSGFDDINKVGSTATVGAADAGDGGSGVVVLRYAMAACSPSSQSSGGYTILSFTSTTTCSWSVPAGVTAADVLVVGGGGGGGDSSTSATGGGGGAGGYFSSTSVAVNGSILISVGAGGSGAASSTTNGTSGGDSTFGTFKVGGGGYGNSVSFAASQRAGSGIGGSGYVSGGSGGGGRSRGAGNNDAKLGGTAGARDASGVAFLGTTYTGLSGAAGGNAFEGDFASGGIGGAISSSSRTSSISGSSTVYSKGGTYLPWDSGSNAERPQTYGSGGATNYNYTAAETAGNTLGGNGAQGVVIVRYVNTPSITLSSNAISAVIGSLSSYSITQGGGPASSYSIPSADSTALTAVGVSFSTSTGLLSGTPTGTLASRSITITATNSTGTTTATFSIVINNPTCSPASQTSGGYTTLTFTNTSTCNWSVPAGVTAADVLVVGGGGGGSGNRTSTGAGGSGGGGGVYKATSVPVSGSVTVTVGSGGAAGASGSTAAGRSGSQGDTSAFGTLTAGGGGGGGCETNNPTNGQPCGVGTSIHGRPGTAGGNGGSPSEFWNAYNPGSPGQATGVRIGTVDFAAVTGFRGGFYNDGGTSALTSAGSAGGAGGAGNFNTPGAGVTSPLTESTIYGRGGSSWNSSTHNLNAVAANIGWGGNGGYSASGTATNGVAGGSGIVVLRYISTYTVTYAYNNATGGNSTATSTFTPGGSAIALPTPTRTGFSFLGWYTLASGGSLVGAAGVDYSPSGTTPGITVQAQWRSSDASLTGLSLSSGTLSPSFATATTSYTATVPTTTSTGYTVTATKSDSNATVVQYIGATGTTAFTGALSIGENVIRTIVTSQDSSTTTTYTVTVTRESAAALNPAFGSPTATADGFTVSITNYSGDYTWATPTVSAGSVAVTSTVGATRVLTVTGLSPGASATITQNTTRTGYANGTATVTGTATTGAALTPTFGTPTATADGFTVQISNYSASYTWAGSATASGSVAIDGSGLVTVTGVAPGTSSVATITTTRTGYTGGSAPVTGTSITGAALTPTFGTPTATADGFTVQISNYSGSYTWAGTATASGSVAINGTGLVTVTGVAPGTQSVATITTTRTGYTGGSAPVTGTSISGAALTPTFGSATATADGFTVQISNYSASYTWAGSATASGSVAIDESGLVTVTGVAPGTSSVATITTTRTGYTSGSATATGTSITGAALTPTFGTPTATADGFTVQISNYSNSYTWAGSATASGSVAINGTGLVTVTGVAPGTSSTATITTTRTGYTGGSATTTGTSITGAALTPTFGTPTATADGFTVQISNYSGDYTWAGSATASGSVAINGTGLVTVTGVAPGTSSTATITTTRTGYTGGSATVSGTSITGSVLTPTFGTSTATADGFTVSITNYSASYTWAGSATASGSVAISGTGLVTVTGVAPGTQSVATITTIRTGYTSGSATVTGTSITGSALTPTFGSATATNSGFTVQISNYSASYTWAGTATASGSVSINGTGLVTVTGVGPGKVSVATITTTRTGYTSGSATVTATANRVAATSTVVTPGTDAALVLVRTTFLQTNPIAARVNTPSKVTFLANNKAIPGCSALKTVLVSSNHTATCNYRPTSLGSLTLSATITPNDTGYIAVTRSVKVVVSPK
jgi:hypothetical protein